MTMKNTDAIHQNKKGNEPIVPEQDIRQPLKSKISCQKYFLFQKKQTCHKVKIR